MEYMFAFYHKVVDLRDSSSKCEFTMQREMIEHIEFGAGQEYDEPRETYDCENHDGICATAHA